MVSSADYHEDSHGERLWKKTKDAPFVPLGILGMVCAVGYGIYGFKHRGAQSASVYLMHTRVKAQSMVVGAMAAGVGYTLLRDHWFSKENITENFIHKKTTNDMLIKKMNK